MRPRQRCGHPEQELRKRARLIKGTRYIWWDCLGCKRLKERERRRKTLGITSSAQRQPSPEELQAALEIALDYIGKDPEADYVLERIATITGLEVQ